MSNGVGRRQRNVIGILREGPARERGGQRTVIVERRYKRRKHYAICEMHEIHAEAGFNDGATFQHR